MFLTKKAFGLIAGNNAPLARMRRFFSKSILMARSDNLGRALDENDLNELFKKDGNPTKCSKCGNVFQPVVALFIDRKDGSIRVDKHSGEPLQRGNFIAIIGRDREVCVKAFCDHCVEEAKITTRFKKLPAQSWEQADLRASGLRRMLEKSKPSTPQLAKKPTKKRMTANILNEPLQKALEEAHT